MSVDPIHWRFDGAVPDVPTAHEISEAVMALVRAVQMTPIMDKPAVYVNAEGARAIILIAESHVSMHVVTEDKRAFVDVFSCKDYSVRAALRAIEASLGGTWIIARMPRGLAIAMPAGREAHAPAVVTSET